MADVDTASPLPAAPGRRLSWWTTSRIVPALVLVLAILVAGTVLRALLHDDDSPGHRAAVSRGAEGSARLDVVGGVDSLRIVAGSGDDLAVASTPETARAVPSVRRAGDRITVSTRSSGSSDDGPVELTVRLAPGVRWSVAVDGGAQRLALDLAGAKLASLDVAQGVGVIEARLPRPSGGLVARIAGGAGTVVVHAPGGVPARVTFSSGTGQGTVDGDHRTGLGAGSVMTTADWATATRDRIDVVMVAGVGSLTLDRAP